MYLNVEGDDMHLPIDHRDYITGIGNSSHERYIVNASHGGHSVCPRLRQLNEALLEPVLVL